MTEPSFYMLKENSVFHDICIRFFVCSGSSPGAGVAYHIKQNFMRENLLKSRFLGSSPARSLFHLKLGTQI